MATHSPETAPVYLAIVAVLDNAHSLDHLPDVVGAQDETAKSAAELCRRAADHLNPTPTGGSP